MYSKAELRQRFLQIRQDFSTAEVQKASVKAEEELINLTKKLKPINIHTYLPIKSNKEINSTGFIKFVLNKTELKIFTSIISDAVMESVEITNLEFVNGKYNIPIPKTIKHAAKDTKFGLIIVPVVAYDSKNNRLGYGKGYYDKFLSTQPNALKVGLAYKNCQVESIPAEPHDIKLDKIIAV